MASADRNGSLPGSLDRSEVEKFAGLAAEWWSPTGKFAALHKLNPPRLAFIRAEAERAFGRSPSARRPFEGLSALDIGCGGGLVAEPVARLGANVTAIDAAPESLAVARGHAEAEGLAIAYDEATAEALAAQGKVFDIVLALEIVEHVPDVPAFLAAAAALVRPGGLIVLSTINRTPKAYALAIFAAERVLHWAPEGAHRYDRLVRPGEIRDALTPHGLEMHPPAGLSYDLLADRWRLTHDVSVNYILSGVKAR
ncbi:MAG: bifunctional 2-polyprenyl-6-hydroxyphenol methylase/3-demethylubiquinol 3-O-methyltransferase UbiG [Alphaproteobacteria bacterium]|nr:bifunctional 2-polyprenyl-6-hydroxyphenol methylase/3-demethylubiquinol 3-O-methyltransferase UbiG [Alphaproteobacteria bacterium]